MKIGMYGGKFLPLHTGHVNCIIQAGNQCDLLYVVLSHSTVRDKLLCDKDGFKYIPKEKRLQWLDQIASSLPNVRVIDIEDFDGEEYKSWRDGANQIYLKIYNDIQDCISVVFGSEKGYRSIFEKLYEGSKYILLDVGREKFPISATKIRKEGVFNNWEFIPSVCKPYYNKKVVIVGTESCGKSTIVKKLALYYNTNYVSEYGRDMCEFLNTGQPTSEYYPYIAYGQKTEEFKAIQSSNKLLVIDTESIVTAYYAKLYADTSFEVLNRIAYTNDYDLVIYLEPDVKWVDDGLRIHGEEAQRIENDSVMKKMIKFAYDDCNFINGDYKQRFDKCVYLINDLLSR